MGKITVIGAGAAGMMAAIRAAEHGASVTIIEKNEKPGKKMYITGKGRCNLTNMCTKDELFERFVTNKKFLFSAVNSFDNGDVCTFFEERGLKLKTERGNRVFPVSDKASDVIKVLYKECERLGVSFLFNTEVYDVVEGSPKAGGGAEVGSDAVIIATGGITYPTTGSTGDGYVFAEQTGHRTVEPVPSLVDVWLKENVSMLQGLSLRNISVKIERRSDGKVIFEEFGEMLFTDKGVSGPVILSASSICGREIHGKKDGFRLVIDLKPALDKKKLDERILRDLDASKNKNINNILTSLLPSALIDVVLERSGIEAHEKANSITRGKRAALVDAVKGLTFEILSLGDKNNAVITKGGVDVKDINPKTMESRLKEHLYFAGEVIDVDALTGGFNLQIAFSTGFAAGEAAGKEEYETDSNRWTCRCRQKHNSKGNIKKA